MSPKPFYARNPTHLRPSVPAITPIGKKRAGDWSKIKIYDPPKGALIGSNDGDGCQLYEREGRPNMACWIYWDNPTDSRAHIPKAANLRNRDREKPRDSPL